mmetsp:Transcript_12941/g.32739  ORF Transcript_12941/g.32739 Transcript_12941/m.32739 type:complete len:237 (+) Transcript_12941:82-792(+)
MVLFFVGMGECIHRALRTFPSQTSPFQKGSTSPHELGACRLDGRRLLQGLPGCIGEFLVPGTQLLLQLTTLVLLLHLLGHALPALLGGFVRRRLPRRIIRTLAQPPPPGPRQLRRQLTACCSHHSETIALLTDPHRRCPLQTLAVARCRRNNSPAGSHESTAPKHSGTDASSNARTARRCSAADWKPPPLGAIFLAGREGGGFGCADPLGTRACLRSVKSVFWRRAAHRHMLPNAA